MIEKQPGFMPICTARKAIQGTLNTGIAGPDSLFPRLHSDEEWKQIVIALLGRREEFSIDTP